MIRRLAVFCFFSLIALSAEAQFAKSIASGRPGNANGTNSVGKGVYQAQIGYNLGGTSLIGTDLEGVLADEQAIQGADGMFRIGLREDFELRISTNAFAQDESDFAGDRQLDRAGLESFAVGFRQTLTEQQGIWPAFCVQFTADFGGIGQYKVDNPDPILRLNFSNQLSDKLVMNYNFSNRWNVDESNMQGFYILNIAYAMSERFTLAAEGFGIVREDVHTLNAGLGLAYLANDDLQLDLYGSYGSNRFNEFQSQQAVWNLSVGISYRLVNR